MFRNLKSSGISMRFFSSETIENPTNRRKFLKQSQGLRAFRPEECPENPTIVLFPGQGSQFVGMAKSFENIQDARNMFEIASEILRLYKYFFY